LNDKSLILNLQLIFPQSESAICDCCAFCCFVGSLEWLRWYL